MILACYFGGEFRPHPLYLGSECYLGESVEITYLTRGTPFSDFLSFVAKTCYLNKDTLSSIRYRLPGKAGYWKFASINDAKDLDEMYHTCLAVAEVFVAGTPLHSMTNRTRVPMVMSLLTRIARIPTRKLNLC